MKEEHLPSAKVAFASTGVNITTHRKCHPGAALGSRSFVESYVQYKVSQWIDTVKKLSSITHTQPHAAYSAFTHGLVSKWSYIMRTIPDISELLVPLNEAIDIYFIPALTGRDSISNPERQLLALPARLGRLGLVMPSQTAPIQHSKSFKVTPPL